MSALIIKTVSDVDAVLHEHASSLQRGLSNRSGVCDRFRLRCDRLRFNMSAAPSRGGDPSRIGDPSRGGVEMSYCSRFVVAGLDSLHIVLSSSVCSPVGNTVFGRCCCRHSRFRSRILA